jgi:hypothetical protein
MLIIRLTSARWSSCDSANVATNAFHGRAELGGAVVGSEGRAVLAASLRTVGAVHVVIKDATCAITHRFALQSTLRLTAVFGRTSFRSVLLKLRLCLVADCAANSPAFHFRPAVVGSDFLAVAVPALGAIGSFHVVIKDTTQIARSASRDVGI